MAHLIPRAFNRLGFKPPHISQIVSHRYHQQPARLTRQQVTSYIRAHELSHDLSQSGYAVTSFDSNYLRSNNPIEDRRSTAKCTNSSGLLFGVFDGHSGLACAQAISERLFPYIALTLLQYDELKFACTRMEESRPSKLLEWYRHRHDYLNEFLAPIYRVSLRQFARDLLVEYERYGHEFDVMKSLEKAFLRLDSDISRECFQEHNTVNFETLPVALSGACASVIYINKRDVYVANVGDCRALLGSINEKGDWVLKPLSVEHNAENTSEVERIKGEHPQSESHNVLRCNRLFGELMPLRAFGDFRYKWDVQKLEIIRKNLSERRFTDIASYQVMPPRDYWTPPYLTACPEITHHKLTPRDKFIVLASDGLWDMLKSEKAVNLVANHLEGKQAQEKFEPSEETPTLGDINKQLLKRKSGIANRPVDTNVATHLIRNALGTTEMGVEHRKISAMLTLPEDIVREYRDDITVTVIHLDTQQVILDETAHVY